MLVLTPYLESVEQYLLCIVPNLAAKWQEGDRLLFHTQLPVSGRDCDYLDLTTLRARTAP